MDLYKMEELLEDYGINEILTNYYSGDTGEFELDEAYRYTGYSDIVRYSENPTADISMIALKIAYSKVPILRRYEELAKLTDDELAILSALEIAKRIQYEENKRRAYYQADEWRYDASKVAQYGTKSRAESRGYDQYMSSHATSKYQFLESILAAFETLNQEQNSNQTKRK